METPTSSKIESLFTQWRSEHDSLDRFAVDLLNWAHDQSKRREAQYREAVAKVSELSERLAKHFARESEIVAMLIAARGEQSPEAAATRRQSERDHTNLTCRLKQLVDRIHESQSERDAWKTSMSELSLILDLLEQHEEQEAESIEWLIPRERYTSLVDKIVSHQQG
jgi:uncharacterized protein (DUF1501 family)